MGKIFKSVGPVFSLGLWACAIGAVGLNLYLSFDHYFDRGRVLVAPQVSATGFQFAASGKPLRVFNGSYKVTLKDFSDLSVLREYPQSGVFQYTPKRTPNGDIASRYQGDVSFDWWVGQEGRLAPLPQGVMVMETCWTVHARAAGLLPAITGCVTSNPFRVE